MCSMLQVEFQNVKVLQTVNVEADIVTRQDIIMEGINLTASGSLWRSYFPLVIANTIFSIVYLLL